MGRYPFRVTTFQESSFHDVKALESPFKSLFADRGNHIRDALAGISNLKSIIGGT